MGRLLRTLMTCMLVLALPVQGAIAASMMFCGVQPYHGVVISDLAAQAAEPEPGCHGHAGFASSAQHSADVNDDDGASASSGTGESPAPQGHKCSVCAACSATGGPLSAVPTLPMAVPTLVLFSDIVALVRPFATEGPDRPPRSPLA